MARKSNHSSTATSATDLGTSWRQDMEEIVSECIDASERLAKAALAFQERIIVAWAKDTPWASLFSAQRNMASQWIEGAANLTRKLWRVEEEMVEKTQEAMTQFAKGEA